MSRFVGLVLLGAVFFRVLLSGELESKLSTFTSFASTTFVGVLASFMNATVGSFLPQGSLALY